MTTSSFYNSSYAEILCPIGISANSDGCFCDWRVQIEGCPSERQFLRDLYLINVVACFVVFLMITGLLIWRTTVRGQRLISKDPLKEMGILKPRPLEGFLLLNLFHVAGRLLYSVCLLSDYIPNNATKEFFHDVTFTLSLAGMAIYLIGLIYTIPKSHAGPRRVNSYTTTPKDRQKKVIWVPRPAIVDAFGFFVLLGPLVSLNTFAILSGAFLDKGMRTMSDILIMTHYLSWSFFCWILISGLLYFGKQLTNILVKHIDDTKEAGRATPLKVRSLEHGLKKLRWVLWLLLGTLLFFALTSCLFAFFRRFLLTFSSFISRTLAALWVLIVPVVNVVIVTVLAHEINDKERVHILRQSTFSSQFSGFPLPAEQSTFKTDIIYSHTRTTDLPFSVHPKPNIASLGRISPIQLPASKLSMIDEDSSVSFTSIDSSRMPPQKDYASEKKSETNHSLPTSQTALQPLAPVHLLTSQQPEFSAYPNILSFGFKQFTEAGSQPTELGDRPL